MYHAWCTAIGAAFSGTINHEYLKVNLLEHNITENTVSGCYCPDSFWTVPIYLQIHFIQSLGVYFGYGCLCCRGAEMGPGTDIATA